MERSLPGTSPQGTVSPIPGRTFTIAFRQQRSTVQHPLHRRALLQYPPTSNTLPSPGGKRLVWTFTACPLENVWRGLIHWDSGHGSLQTGVKSGVITKERVKGGQSPRTASPASPSWSFSIKLEVHSPGNPLAATKPWMTDGSSAPVGGGSYGCLLLGSRIGYILCGMGGFLPFWTINYQRLPFWSYWRSDLVRST